jgi:transcriptional regulator with XRE-family HTH domain
MRNNDRGALAANLRAEIARQRKRQADLADLWRVSEMAVSRRLTGSTPISAEQLAAAADWLGVEVGALLPVEVAS